MHVRTALFLAATSLLSPAMADEPPVFDKRPFAESRRAAVETKKWFIVKATAEWCGPCKQMDKTTWRDEGVVKWLTAHAIAKTFDVDQSPELSREFAIEAMPTMIALKEGKEFDRIVGYKSPADFLVWLEGLARGEKSIEVVKKRAQKQDAQGRMDMHARMELACHLARSGEAGKAADEYIWLWKNMIDHEPGMYGVRLSFMAGDMERLAARHDGAKKKFIALRDESAKAIDGDKIDMEDLVDWVTLNKIVGDRKATLAWFDRVKEEPRFRPLLARVERNMEDLLIEDNRWADLGSIYTRPLERVEQAHELLTFMSQHNPPGVEGDAGKAIEEVPFRIFREKMSRMYAGLLAAGRYDDAEKVAIELRKLDPAPKMTAALVSTALRAGCPRPDHIKWLTEDKNMSQFAELRDSVRAALDAPPKK